MNNLLTKNVTLKIEKENLEFFKKYSKENKIEMSSFVRNLILYKIYDEITKEDEKRILKRQEKSKLEKNKFSWRYF